MPPRKPFVGGNWKMNLHRAEVVALARAVAAAVSGQDRVEVAVCPPFPYLGEVGEALRGSGVKLGAQDVYFQANGAFTGEVSASMLEDVGVAVVLAGHSERRHVLGETDELVNLKVRAALVSGLEVILCVGEKLEQRQRGQTDFINAGQTLLGLAGVTAEQLGGVTIAYEPVWAIGTGKNATAQDAQAAHEAIRRTLAEAYGEAAAAAVRIQYGGSVKPSNAAELFAEPDIDGGLIGGASLRAEDFAAIVNAAQQLVVGA